MLMDEAIRLRKHWLENGDPPCQHTKRMKEYYSSGEDTGKEVCTHCGQIFTRYDAPRLQGKFLIKNVRSEQS